MPHPYNTPRYQDLTKFRLPDGFRARGALLVQPWWILQGPLFAVFPQVSYGWRRMLLRAFCAKNGRNVPLRPTTHIPYPWKFSSTVISQDCYICAAGHYADDISFRICQKNDIIDDGGRLATQTVVMQGLTIARGALAMVRSLITRDIPEAAVKAKAPAKIVGKRTPNDIETPST